MADKNCFGQEFMTTPNSWPVPSKAQEWESIEDCREAYEEFLLECDSDDQTPAPHWLYLGIPDGNEEDYGYRDYPDYFVEPEEEGSTEAMVRNA